MAELLMNSAIMPGSDRTAVLEAAFRTQPRAPQMADFTWKSAIVRLSGRLPSMTNLATVTILPE